MLALNQDIRRPGFIDFSPDDRFLVFESSERINVMDIKTNKFYPFEINGKLKAAGFHSQRQIIALACIEKTNQKKCGVYLSMPENIILLKNLSSKQIEFLRFIENRLLVGFDHMLIMFDIAEV